MKVDSRSYKEETLQLDCPFCAASVELSRGQLADGLSVACPHCREEATLVRERIEHGDRDQWKLIELEFDDERR